MAKKEPFNWKQVGQGILVVVGSSAALSLIGFAIWLFFLLPPQLRQQANKLDTLDSNVVKIRDMQLMQMPMIAVAFAHVLNTTKEKNTADSLTKMYFDINKKYMEKTPEYKKILDDLGNKESMKDNLLIADKTK